MRKIFTFVLFIFCFSDIAMCQSKQDYFISKIPKTIITNEPEYLNVTDTINKNRRFSSVSNLLGGLSPAYPMAKSNEQIAYDGRVSLDCISLSCHYACWCINFLVEINDTIIEIGTKEKFREIFAPVESKEEALSFAYALTGLTLFPIYDFSFLKEEGIDYNVFRKEIKPTSVKELPDGYEVILFDTYYGYVPSYSEVLIFVSKDGSVDVLKTEQLLERIK
jgi:hypothetical protein